MLFLRPRLLGTEYSSPHYGMQLLRLAGSSVVA